MTGQMVKEFVDGKDIIQCRRHSYAEWMQAAAQGRTPNGDDLRNWQVEVRVEGSTPPPVLCSQTASWCVTGEPAIPCGEHRYVMQPGSVARKRCSGSQRIIYFLPAKETHRPRLSHAPKPK